MKELCSSEKAVLKPQRWVAQRGMDLCCVCWALTNESTIPSFKINKPNAGLTHSSLPGSLILCLGQWPLRRKMGEAGGGMSVPVGELTLGVPGMRRHTCFRGWFHQPCLALGLVLPASQTWLGSIRGTQWFPSSS